MEECGSIKDRQLDISVSPRPGLRPTSCPLDTVGLFFTENVKLTTHFKLVLRSEMPLHAFTVWYLNHLHVSLFRQLRISSVQELYKMSALWGGYFIFSLFYRLRYETTEQSSNWKLSEKFNSGWYCPNMTPTLHEDQIEIQWLP